MITVRKTPKLWIGNQSVEALVACLEIDPYRVIQPSHEIAAKITELRNILYLQKSRKHLVGLCRKQLSDEANTNIRSTEHRRSQREQKVLALRGIRFTAWMAIPKIRYGSWNSDKESQDRQLEV